MRNLININNDWQFFADNINIEKIDSYSYQKIDLPHTWNNIDGQGGKGGYKRAKCWYKKNISEINFQENKQYFLEFNGANHVANVWFNDAYLGEHKGGFSTFRFDITELITKNNTLVVSVDNSDGLKVYPQNADFTFDGGLYRDVNIVEVNKVHFDLLKFGSTGIFVTPKITNDGAQIRFDALTNTDLGSNVIEVTVDNNIVKLEKIETNHYSATLLLVDYTLWDSIKNPFLYNACFSIKSNGETIDEITTAFGIRNYSVDSNEGFILNNENFNLRGVCRHQCREDIGWAINKSHHEEDIKFITEVGANTIRLAHYQHDQYFYDLCDKNGLVIWAEIPFISSFIPGEEARANTVSQMTELIYQNYNHASICFWGISNEITIGGDSEELVENLQLLNKLTKELDPTRLTTLANVSMVNTDSSHNDITDVFAYNHYYGWYSGDVSENGPWFDEFHKNYPDKKIGLSEYGAEGLIKWHSEDGKRRDYSEEYHAIYHEKMLECFESRDYIWGTFCWNMFDFAAALRDEGGCVGRNNKGLMTFDRKTKKDAFYIYKAYWTKEKFCHITGKRFVEHDAKNINIKAYSNDEQVTLYVNKKEIETLSCHKVFEFKNVELQLGENTIEILTNSGKKDLMVIKHTEKTEIEYQFVEVLDVNEDVVNWFANLLPTENEIKVIDGYYSLHDTISSIASNPSAMNVIMLNIMQPLAKLGGESMFDPSVLLKDDGFGKMKFIDVWAFISNKFPAHAKFFINEELNKIKK